MKKILFIAALAAVGYVIYRQVSANQAEQDLWTEATSQPDLR
ncbi:MAG TPA: DLW-39 family protein [Actinomycetota bacterium]|nr:DLW-39 family protein [Actinomycetota bacterium]